MKSSDLVFCLGLALVLACGGGGGDDDGGGGGGDLGEGGSSGGGDPASPAVSGDNVMEITVNGSLCNDATSYNYPNKPCVGLEVCEPGTSTCQAIDDILLDTGSYGLRVFSSALSDLNFELLSLSGDATLGECAYFGDGTVLWGPIVQADVLLGGEEAVTIPIQLMDSSYMGTSGHPCDVDFGNDLVATPSEAGFNGILGVGPFATDCGTGCETATDNGYYYACTATTPSDLTTETCEGTTVPEADQVANPVAVQPLHNNGVIVVLPEVGDDGASSATGYMILGIDTQNNNVSGWEKTLDSDENGLFSTTYKSKDLQAFTDTGSVGLYFYNVDGDVTECASGAYGGWFCPATTQSLSATVEGYANGESVEVDFEIRSVARVFSQADNMVFDNIGGPTGDVSLGLYFDWGLPFHFGKKVYIGLSGESSDLGTGPYVAF